MEFLSEYGLFLAEALTVVIAILMVAVGLLALGQRGQRAAAGHIEINKLNDRYSDYKDAMQHALLNDREWKKQRKAEKKKHKSQPSVTAKQK